MAITYKDMVDAANKLVPAITAAEAAELVKSGNAVIVDVRDGTEVAATGNQRGGGDTAGLAGIPSGPDLGQL